MQMSLNLRTRLTFDFNFSLSLPLFGFCMRWRSSAYLFCTRLQLNYTIAWQTGRERRPRKKGGFRVKLELHMCKGVSAKKQTNKQNSSSSSRAIYLALRKSEATKKWKASGKRNWKIQLTRRVVCLCVCGALTKSCTHESINATHIDNVLPHYVEVRKYNQFMALRSQRLQSDLIERINARARLKGNGFARGMHLPQNSLMTLQLSLTAPARSLAII